MTSQSFDVAETAWWDVSHRGNTALPGYLAVTAKIFTNDLAELPEPALGELGPLLGKAEGALKQGLQARRVYVGRYGYAPGLTLHFHVIPIYAWVEKLFWKDTRYRLLEAFAEGPGTTATDDAELTLFVWREFCERMEPPPAEGPSVSEAIALLRAAIRQTSMPASPLGGS